MGKADNHEDTPRSLAQSINLRWGLATDERCCWPYLTAASLSSSRDSRGFLEKEVLVDDLVNKWGRDFFR